MSLFPKVTEYSILDGEDCPRHQITVKYRGGDLWGVFRGGQCLSTSGKWDWEPLPSARTKNWITNHRFSESDALAAALKLAEAEA